jgi:hypothetical protein
MTKRLQQTLAILAALGMLHTSVSKAARPYDAPSSDQPQDADDEVVAGFRESIRPAPPPRRPAKSTAASTSTAGPSQRTINDRPPADARVRRNAEPNARNDVRSYARNGTSDNRNRQTQVSRTNWQAEPMGEAIGEPEPTYAPGAEQRGAASGGYRSSNPNGPAPVYAPRNSSMPNDGFMADDGDPQGYGFDAGFGGGCGPDCGGACGPCGPCRGPVYVRGEYLLWWLNGDSLPPLVTTSPSGTSQGQAGVLGQPGTSVLFGDQAVNNMARSGARLTAGWWFAPTARLEGDVFGLGGQRANFDQASNGDTILARPFFNLSTGAQGSDLLAFPATFAGQIAVSETSNFNGAGIHILHSVLYDQSPHGFMRRVDLLYGFRYLGLYENLTVNSSAATIDPTVPTTSLTTFDGFKTSNSFFGANFGASMESSRGRWSLLSTGRLGIGGTVERVTISGSSTATANGTSTTSPGGLLAMPTNIGTYSHGAFTLVPHLEFKLAYNFSPSVRFTVGYDILYWSQVVRPGQQVDLFVNPSQAASQPLVGTIGPLFGFHQTSLWAQGLSVGGEFRF